MKLTLYLFYLLNLSTDIYIYIYIYIMKTRHLKKITRKRKSIRKRKHIRRSRRMHGAAAALITTAPITTAAGEVITETIGLTGATLQASADVIRGASNITKNIGVAAEIGGIIIADTAVGAAGVAQSTTKGLFGAWSLFSKTCFLLHVVTDQVLSLTIDSITSTTNNLQTLSTKCNSVVLTTQTSVRSFESCLQEYTKFLKNLILRDNTALFQIKRRMLLNISNCMMNIDSMMKKIGCKRSEVLYIGDFKCLDKSDNHATNLMLMVEVDTTGKMTLIDVDTYDDSKRGQEVSREKVNVSEKYKELVSSKKKFKSAFKTALADFTQKSNSALASIQQRTNAKPNDSITKIIKDYNNLAPSISIEAELIKTYLNPIIYFLDLLQQFLKAKKEKEFQIEMKAIKQEKEKQVLEQLKKEAEETIQLKANEQILELKLTDQTQTELLDALQKSIEVDDESNTVATTIVNR